MPDSVNDLLHLAENAIYRENDQKKALEYLEAALTIEKKSLKAFLLRGVAELRSGLAEAAGASFAKALRLDKNNTEARLNLAVTHIMNREYPKAKALLDKVISQHARGEAYEIQGDMALLQGQYQEGAGWYGQALEVKPAEAHVYFKKAVCHYQLGQFKDCYKYAELSSELNPAFDDAGILSETAADEHVYGELGFLAKLILRPLRPYLKKQLKEQIQIHDEMLKIQKKAEELSVDPLMKIKNRSYFENVFEQLCEAAKQKKTGLCLVFIDLDNMKVFNELFGHPVLDKILGLLGEIFNASVRAQDLVARYAGDEFVMALPNCSKKGAKRVLDSILAKVEEMNRHKLAQLKVDKPITFSVGIAGAPEDTDDEPRPWSNQLVEKADLAALWAKHNGKNQSCFYESRRRSDFRQLAEDITQESKRKALKGERA
ncbi:diguanylate cyclase [candidate division FCPU426 bacterium]|nr:diguanylate cyclase [candidate division FCPU426 bacterium]